MTIQKYTENVLKTIRTDLPEDMVMCNILLGLSGETGELVDIFKKHLFQGHDLDQSKVTEEIGDILFYLTWLAHSQGTNLEYCMLRNNAKLQMRFPNGFTTQDSIDRKDKNDFNK